MATNLINRDTWFNQNEMAKLMLFSKAFQTACANDQDHVLLVLSKTIATRDQACLRSKACLEAANKARRGNIQSFYRILSVLSRHIFPQTDPNMHYQALRQAAEKGHYRTVKTLVGTYSSQLSQEAFEDAVLAASGNGHVEVLRWLMPRLKGTKTYQNLLERAHHLAASQGRFEAIKFLSKDVADVDTTYRAFVDFRDKVEYYMKGYGPLAHIPPPRMSSPLQELLSKFKRPDPGIDMSLLHYRHWVSTNVEEKEASLMILLDNGADVWSLGGFSQSPLERAVQYCSPNVIRGMFARVSQLGDAPIQKLLCAAASREISTTTTIEEIVGHFGVSCLHKIDCSPALTNLLEFFEVSSGLYLVAEAGRFFHTNCIDDVFSTGPGAAIKRLLPLCPKTRTDNTRYCLLQHMASVRDDVDCVRLLIEKGSDPNVVVGYYGTCLQAASRMDNLNMCKFLIAAGADPNILGGQYGRPLRAAVQAQQGDIVDYLIDNGADVNTPAMMRHSSTVYPSVLYMAVEKNDIGIASSLIQAGADINCPPPNTPYALPMLIEACRSGNTALVRLLMASGADPHKLHALTSYSSQRDIKNISALHMACAMGHQTMVRDLLDYGVDLESSGLSVGTPLCAAAFGAHLSTLTMLLEAGANLDEETNGSALWFAACSSQDSAIVELLSSGATLGIRHDSRNALKEASNYCHRRHIVQLLLDSVQGSSEEMAACEDALADACERKDDSALKFSLDYSAAPFPGLLHQASSSGLEMSMRTLLTMHEDPDEPNSAGIYPLQLADARGQEDVVKLLSQHGAMVDNDDAKQGTPLLAALDVAESTK